MPKTYPTKAFAALPRLLLAVIVAASLAACGGGGGSGTGPDSPKTDNILTAQYKANIQEISTEQYAQASVQVMANGGAGLVLTPVGDEFAGLEIGQTVVLGPNEQQGLPFGYTGVVLGKENNQVTLRDANIEDVFENLVVDYDSARETPAIETFSMPDTKLKIASASSTTGSMSRTDSGTDLVLEVNRDAGLNTVLTGRIEIKDLRVISLINYSLSDYPGTYGLDRFTYEVKGQTSASLRLRPKTADGKEASINWGNIFPKLNGGNYVWDRPVNVPIPGTSWLPESAKYFSLSGLDASDRQGLVPLGGLVLIPGAVTAFSNQPTILQQIAPMSIVIWLYLDANGEVKLLADNTLLDANSGIWHTGFRIERESATQLRSTILKDFGNPKVSSHVNEAVQASQEVGVTIGADVIFSGIRPATGKVDLFNMELKGNFQASKPTSVTWYPSFAVTLPREPEFCASYSLEVFSEASYKVGLSATVPGFGEYKYQKSAKTDRIKWGALGDFYAKNCPMKTALTVAKVIEDPQVVQNCGSGDQVVPCNLFCTNEAVVGDQQFLTSSFSAATLKSRGASKLMLDDEEESFFDGIFDLQYKNNQLIGLFTAQKLLDMGSARYGDLDYTSRKELKVRSDVDRASAEFNGKFTRTMTNSWSRDNSTVSCVVEFDMKSEVDWKIK
ncbi:MAG: hypothetical protein ACR2JA_07395, partial [Hydrogenophaga sp.]|uniref:hypothetical protein n=1 Tax=Hydrogenophaga sp. TaxID=1904254 RepID=UPI003D9B7C91